jgi:RimJ/RimL family protein N-acetyltransferase
MIEQVELHTARLRLRPFTLDDAPEVQRLAGSPEIAKMTLTVPHPYKDGMAEAWIRSHPADLAAGKNVVYAIVRNDDSALVGTISVAISAKHRHGELGYWIGTPFWGHGYCTETASAMVSFCFGSLGLHRVHAHHLAMNPASGRVMQKIGMVHEGCLRQHVEKDGTLHDVVMYGLLKEDPAGV